MDRLIFFCMDCNQELLDDCHFITQDGNPLCYECLEDYEDSSFIDLDNILDLDEPEGYYC